MDLTVKQMIKALKTLPYQDKSIVIKTENGQLFEPKIKIILNNEYDMESGVKSYILTY